MRAWSCEEKWRLAATALFVQPSSAAAERVFSLLKSSFGDQQEAALQDYIETSLMLQFKLYPDCFRLCFMCNTMCHIMRIIFKSRE